MPRRTANSQEQLGFVGELLRNAKLVWSLILDFRVPFTLKLLIPGALAYLISPIDVIPDVLVSVFGLGIADDLAVVVLAIRLFLAAAPAAIVEEHRSRLAGAESRRKRYDATFRVVDDR